MSRPLLSVHVTIKDAVRLDYPLREACRTAYTVADELVIACHPTGDGTEDWCSQICREFPNTIVFYEPWMRPERKDECISDGNNYCIERCSGVYHLKLDADDGLPDGAAPVIRQAMREARYDWFTFPRLHIFPDASHRLPHGGQLPAEALWCARRDTFPRFRSAGDGTGMGTPDSNPYDFSGSRIEVPFLHYSLLRKPIALADKILAMAALYQYEPSGSPAEHARERGSWDWEEVWPGVSAKCLPLEWPHPQAFLPWLQERGHGVRV